MAVTALLAAPGPGDFLPVLFVLIAIASGIINFVKERKAAAGKANLDSGDFAAREKVDHDLQSEIDAFLEEVSPVEFEETSPPRRATPEQQRRRRRASSDEEAERRRRARARREHAKRQKKTAQKQQQSVENRQLETSGLNDVSSRHEVANRHVDSSVRKRHLEDHIDGPSDATVSPAVQQTGNGSIAELLRKPEGIRDAILLNEVLGPPLASRPRRKH